MVFCSTGTTELVVSFACMKQVASVCLLISVASHHCIQKLVSGIHPVFKLSFGRKLSSANQIPTGNTILRSCLRIDDDSGSIENRVASASLSEFDQQIIRDHPESSVAECKRVANMLLKRAEFANRLGDKSL